MATSVLDYLGSISKLKGAIHDGVVKKEQV